MNPVMTDVVVVGAGPTGLLLAIELALGGVRPLVLERLPEPDPTIKAGAVGALGAEALQRRGLGPAMDAEERIMSEAMAAMFKRMNPQGPVPQLGKIGGHFAGLFLIDQSRQREPQRRFRGVKQIALERMLGERAGQLGIEVRRGCELLDFRDDGSGVDIEIRGAGGPETLRAGWLVGCDGGRSMVRKRAGFDFPGTAPTLTGYQAIVELDHPGRLLPLGWRRTATGMLTFGPVPGRILTVEFDGPPAERDAPVTIEEVQASLRRVSGAEVTIHSMSTATRFTDNARQATSYRRGRVLLAGDAAHVHSPFGGQGLNLGLLDAVNLGWKLAAVVRGALPQTLLDSYTEERHAVAARVLENTRAQVALMRPDAQSGALRNIVAELMGLDQGTRYFGELISGTRVRYALDGEHPLTGSLCGNAVLTVDGMATDVFTLMQQGGGLLIDAADGAATALAGARVPQLRCVRTARGTSMLLRPDACVAWAADDGRTDGLEAALQRWFAAA